MSLIPEIVPDLTKEVVYDERLLDLEFADTDGIDREEIDKFWASLFYAHITNEDRRRLGSEDVQIEDFEVLPADYDLDAREDTVVVSAYASCKSSMQVHVGGVAYARLGIDGVVTDEHGKERQYSGAMKPYVRTFLAHVALNYKPLEMDDIKPAR